MQTLFVLVLVNLFADQLNAGHAPEKGRKTGRALRVTLLLYAPGLREIIAPQRIPLRPLVGGKLGRSRCWRCFNSASSFSLALPPLRLITLELLDGLRALLEFEMRLNGFAVLGDQGLGFINARQ